MDSKKTRKSFKKGRTFENYEILRLIGQGGFSNIYHVKNKEIGQESALKTEVKPCKGNFLTKEIKIIQELQDSKLFARYSASGETNEHTYLVMEILGPSLASVRKILHDHKFSMSTAIRVGVEMLRSIKELHRHGYVHRDIKPANFLIRSSRSTPLVLIDYGLARSYVDPETKELYPSRVKTGFVGTAKYASINAHECHELGRRDDIISWFYSLLEIIKGELPWPSNRDKKAIYEAKKAFNVEDFCKDMPKQMQSIFKTIEKYAFEDEPNCDLLTSFLVQVIDENNIDWNEPFDWEKLSQEELKQISVISLSPPDGDLPHIPTNLPKPVLEEEEESSAEANKDRQNHEEEEEIKEKEVQEEQPVDTLNTIEENTKPKEPETHEEEEVAEEQHPEEEDKKEGGCCNLI